MTRPDGLTTTTSENYASGWRITTRTGPGGETEILEYYRDRRLYSRRGTAVPDRYFHPGVGPIEMGGNAFEGIAETFDAAGSNEVYLRVRNWLGDEIALFTPKAGGGERTRTTFYDTFFDGQNDITRRLPAAIYESGHAPLHFAYDPWGRLIREGLDLDGSGNLDPASADRITDHEYGFTGSGSTLARTYTARRYLAHGDPTPSLVIESRVLAPAALPAGSITSGSFRRGPSAPWAAFTAVLDRSTGTLTETVADAESGRSVTSISRDGLLRSRTVAGVSVPDTFSYTPLAEPATVASAASGTTAFTYDPATRRIASATDALGRQTLFAYHPAGIPGAGRLAAKRDPAGHWTRFEYTAAGQTRRVWGENTYPSQFAYDEDGNLTALTTWRTLPGAVDWSSAEWPNPLGGDTTTWLTTDPPACPGQNLPRWRIRP